MRMEENHSSVISPRRYDTCIGSVSIIPSLQGVAFEAKHTATGIASHLLTQVIEDETRDVSYLFFPFLRSSHYFLVPYRNPPLFRRLLLTVRRRNRSFVVQLNWRSITIVWLTMNSRLEWWERRRRLQFTHRSQSLEIGALQRLTASMNKYHPSHSSLFRFVILPVHSICLYSTLFIELRLFDKCITSTFIF